MKNLKLLFLFAFLTAALFTQKNVFAQIQIKPTGNALNDNMPKAIGQIGTAADLGTNTYKNTFKSAQAPCPVPAFDFSPVSPINCNRASCIDFDVRDSAFASGAVGEWMQHCALIVVQTDAFNDAQNTLEIWSGATLILRVGNSNTGTGTPQQYFTWPGFFGSSMNSKTAKIWLYHICPAQPLQYKWFDSGSNASNSWYVWDSATNTVKGSGTFTGASDQTGTYTNWGGIATWSCPTCPAGSLQQTCSAAFGKFCPSSAKPGKYGITYTWDNTLTGVDACKNSYTDTIEVLPINNSTWAPPSSICATSSSTSLTSYLDPFATSGGVWSGSGVSGNNWNTTGLSGNITITYTVGGGTSCESKESHVITVNPKPTVSIAPVTAICGTGSPSNVTLTASGTATTYTWAPGGAVGTTTTVNPSSTATYTVTGSSAAGCTTTQTITVTINPQPTVTSAPTDVKCNGAASGFINTTPASGTPGYTYSWSNNATTQNISGLSGGGYTLTITDSKSCTVTTSATINEPGTKVTATNPAGTPTGCGANATTGTVAITGSGGTGTLTYVWNPGAKTGASVNNLGANTYTVTVTDANGCTATNTATVAPPSGGPIITGASTSTTCNGGTDGSATSNATGGSLTYDILWSPGGATGKNISSVGAGSYTVTYTDKVSACVSNKTIIITEPAPFAMGPTVTNINCKGQTTGAITLNPSGNTAPYTYKWSPGGATSKNISPLTPATYTLTVTDLNACSKTFTYTITEPATSSTATISNPVQPGCGLSNGSATATGSNGTGPYSYVWSTTPPQTTATASGLVGNTYTVTVTDSKTCTATTTVTLAAAGAPTATATQTTQKCFGDKGTATVSTTGGTAPLTYTWSNGGGSSTTATNLPAGPYTVTVLDASNCSVITNVTITTPTVVAPNTTSVSANCGKTDGSVSSAPTGGTGTYTYSWSTPPGGTTPSLTTLAAGSYTVTVIDANGCSKTSVATVGSAAGPTAAFTPSAVTGNTPLDVAFSNTSSSNSTKWYWSFGDGQTDSINKNPSHIYSTEGTFKACLIVSTSTGCLDSTCSDIKVSGFVVTVPNIITPNGDNRNDVFKILAKGVAKMDVSIYDRWGLKLYEVLASVPDATNYVIGWDGRASSGKEAPDGTYYYILKAYGFDTKTYEYKGFVTLIR
jgi:gliding motility-associated-like protein